MLVAADLSTSGAASEPRRYVMNDLPMARRGLFRAQSMSKRLGCYGVRAKHLGRDARLVWRPALESSLDSGAPLRAGLASREIAANTPKVGLIFWVELELQLGNVQLEPRRDELADCGFGRPIEL